VQISLKSLLSDAKSGFATLPHLIQYREELDDSPVDMWEGTTITCMYSRRTKDLFLFIIKEGMDVKKAAFTTLSRKGFEHFKEIMWKEFDNFQQNNVSRYYDKIKKNKVKLTEQQFYDTVRKQFDDIEFRTLFHREIYEKRVQFIKETCEFYGLDYDKFKENRNKKKEKQDQQD
jgi:hypothetical protein